MTTLIIGSTGKVGKRLVQFLVAYGEAVRAGTRNPDQITPTPLIQPVAFDFADHATFAPALAGADKVFMIAPQVNPQDVDAFVAQAGQVKHIVLMTANGIQYAPESPLGLAEKAVKESGIPYTILRPDWFMQNFVEGAFASQLAQSDALKLPAADAQLAFIDARDIAASAAAALLEPGHAGIEYTLTGGQALDHAEAARIIGAVSGRKISYEAVSAEEFKTTAVASGLPAPYADMLNSLFESVRQGASAQIADGVEKATGRPPLTFEQFAIDHADAWR